MNKNKSFFNSNITRGVNSVKKVFSVLIALVIVAACSTAVLATGTGGIPVGYPTLTVGYTNGSWAFNQFAGTPALFTLASANLQTADTASAVFGATLRGTNTPTALTAVTSKTMAVLNHAASFVLYPTQATSPFPSVWVKGDTVNTATGVDAPATWLSGTDANKFFQTGLTIQAPYWEAANYQWTVYVYADKDLLTQTAGLATGNIQDPNVATMRWFAFTDDTNGIAKATWGVKNSGDTAATMFNTLPLIASAATAATKKTFLTGTTGVSLAPSAVPGIAQASIPATGVIHYNTDRNTAAANNANSFVITGRSQIGLVYAAPSGAASHRTENIHMQFIAVWPNGIGVSAGSKTVDIGLYQRTAN